MDDFFRIVDFRFFVKLHRSGPAIIFSFWSLTEHVSYASKKLLIKQKTSSTWCMLLWKDYVWFLIKLSIFDFLWNLTGPDMQKFSGLELAKSMIVIHQKSSKSSKRSHQHGECYSGRIMDGFLRIVDLRFFIKFHRSRPAIIFNFWTLREHVSYASKKLLNKQKTS